MGNPHSSPWLFQYQTGRLDDRAKKQNHTGLAMARGIQSKIVLPEKYHTCIFLVRNNMQ
jgi:hypothetical protein